MLMSAVSAENFDSIYHQKGIITAFKEAGFKTAFFSNQRYNNFIDFLEKKPITVTSSRKTKLTAGQNLSDDYLLALVQEELAKGNRKQFIVLHTYGSHFNYRERYPAEAAFFQPDSPADAEFKYRSD